MPRYNLKDVLQSTALVAVGLSLIAAVFARKPPGATWPDLGARPSSSAAHSLAAGSWCTSRKLGWGFCLVHWPLEYSGYLSG
jgi:hypothetical protein